LALGGGLTLIAVAAALAPFVITGARDWLFTEDPWLATVTEMKAMVKSPITSPASWEHAWRLGGWGFLAAPLFWIGLAWEARRPRDPARAAMLAIALGLFVFSHLQNRFGWTFAPFSALLLAAALGRGPGGALLVVLSVARGADEAEAAWVKPKTANVRLAWVIDACDFLREQTPAVNPTQPEWGVASTWPYGHFVSAVGERPEHFGPFGTYAGGVSRFFETEAMFHGAEAELLALMDRDRLRYVLVTSRDLAAVTGPLRALRHAGSGGADVPALTGLRAVYVSNRLDESVPQRVPAAWVYERVAGAQIEGVTQPGVTVPFALDLLLGGTRGRYVAEAVADEAGRFRLTVPYWTGAVGEVRTARAARMGLPEGPVTVEIPEGAVREGRTLAAPTPPSLVPVLPEAASPEAASPEPTPP
jgi:asparagine N-glycosylation enzyme membrane subunit Stt3